MSNQNALLSSNSDNWCLSTADKSIIVVYLIDGGTDTIDLSTIGSNNYVYTVKWYDPLTGDGLLNGSVMSLTANPNRGLGNAPSNPNGQDWAILLTSQIAAPTPLPTPAPVVPSAPPTRSPTPAPVVSPTLPPAPPTGTPTPAPVVNPPAPVVTGFAIWDAQDDTNLIADIQDGDTYTRSQLGSFQLNVEAITNPPDVSEFRVKLESNAFPSRTESVTPYMLFGDNSNGNIYPPVNGSWQVGQQYTIKATIIQKSSDQAISAAVEISFFISE